MSHPQARRTPPVRSRRARPDPAARPAPAPRVLALAVLALAAAGCGDGFRFGPAADSAGVAAPERERTRVRVQPVEQREMVHAIETHTVVESERQVQIFPRIVGPITELLVEEGDAVTTGQILARLDRREAALAVEEAAVAADEARSNVENLQLAVQEAEARVAGLRRTHEQAELDHRRNERIAATGGEGPALISAKDLDASRLTRDSARSELDQAELALQRARVEHASARTAVDRAELARKQAEVTLSHTELLAPFDGVIAERTIELGDMASTSTPAFVLTDPHHLRVRFYRPQRELALFAAAGGGGLDDGGGSGARLSIQATAEAHPGHVFTGRIQRVAPTVDAEAGAFRVTAALDRAAVDDPEAMLLPGMLVRLRIVTDRHAQALVVPKRALRREGDATIVFAVEGGVARRVEVREGFTSDQHVEVLPLEGQALAAGEPIVVVGNRDLESGVEVDVEAPAGAPTPLAPPPPGPGDAEGILAGGEDGGGVEPPPEDEPEEVAGG